MRHRISTLTIAAMALALVAAGCSGIPQIGHASRDPVRGGTLHVASSSDIPSLDPAIGVDPESLQFVDSIFAQLVTYSPKSLAIIPALATTWGYNAAQTRLTLHLRRARFSNGDPVTAQDVKFSLTRILNPATGASLVSPFLDIVGAAAYNTGQSQDVPGLVVVNPTTIEIDLKQPEPYFLKVLASGSASILDPSVVAQHPTDLSSHPVGAGPFMLKSWTPGRQLVLVRNPYYWQHGLPYISRIVVDIGMSSADQLRAFQAGRLDIIGGSLSDTLELSQTTYQKASQERSLRQDLMTGTALEVYSMQLNTQISPFNQPLVRQAMMYAVDRPALVRALGGRGVEANQYLPPGMPGYDQTLSAIPYSPRKARSLLAQAGYPKGVTFTLVTLDDPASTRVAQAMQSQMQKAGITMNLLPENLSSYLNAIRVPGRTQASYGVWLADYPDPQDFLVNLYSGRQGGIFDISFFDSPEVDSLLQSADMSTSASGRLSQYQAAQALILKAAPAIPLFYGQVSVLKAKGVQPSEPVYYTHPALPIQFQYLWK